MTVFFLVFYNTFAGVRETDKDLIDLTRLMGADRLATLKLVVLPSAMSFSIFTGLKISIPYALIAAVVGEMMAANKGLGYLISIYRRRVCCAACPDDYIHGPRRKPQRLRAQALALEVYVLPRRISNTSAHATLARRRRSRPTSRT